MQDYLCLIEKHPELFVNPTCNGAIVIKTTKSEIEAIEKETAARLKEKGHSELYSKVGIVYQDQYLLILRDAVIFPDGARGTYIRVLQKHDKSNVAVLPKFRDKFLLIRHFRHATRSIELEIPRGFGEKDISPEENAKKELYEEIEGTIASLTSLGSIIDNSGIGNSHVNLFFAELESYGTPELHEGITDICLMTTDEVRSAVLNGDIQDSFTVAAIGKAMLLGLFGTHAASQDNRDAQNLATT